MTVLLVLAFFVVLISMDYVVTRQRLARESKALAAAAIRILIIPPIVVIPGVVAYKLFGDVGDAAYGRLVAEVLPGWLAGLLRLAKLGSLLLQLPGSA